MHNANGGLSMNSLGQICENGYAAASKSAIIGRDINVFSVDLTRGEPYKSEGNRPGERS